MSSLSKTWVASRRSLVANVARWLAAVRVSRGLPSGLTVGAVAFAASPGPDSVPTRLPSAQGGEAQICVSVHAPGGAHYANEATVILRQGGTDILVSRAPGQILYEGLVPPGTYDLVVTTAEALAARTLPVEIPLEGKIASAYLGMEDWPFYRLGENIIPYDPLDPVSSEPLDHFLAVVFEVGKPDADEARERLAQFGDLPITQLADDPQSRRSFAVANGAIWLFKLTEPDRREFVIGELRQRLAQSGRQLRIGTPVDLTAGQVKVLDNRYVVRFQPGKVPTDAERFARDNGGARLSDRVFIQRPDIRLVEFPDSEFRAQLGRIDDLVTGGQAVYAEPDLLSEIIDTALSADYPNEDMYDSQTNLHLQKVWEAWDLLDNEVPPLTLGSPDVFVATLDTELQLTHLDIAETPAAVAALTARCFNFSTMLPCTDPSYGPGSYHGMGVYGIIAARTNNDLNVAGIAPGTTHMAIRRPDVDSVMYKDVLLWIAGLETGNPDANWPAEPLARGADIINCSHMVRHLALSGYMDDTLVDLTTLGRGGRGTVVVYGSGNDGNCITGTCTWAAHASTLAIANSKRPIAGVEQRTSDSNWGREIDLCARGAKVWSLDHLGGEDEFEGTSAAAPTVAAAAALMLSVNPDLTWQEVRQILCDKADQIDEHATGVMAWTPDGTFSQGYGHGRLNVLEAVAEAIARLPD
jgi:subtilisin family serine protease